jgi:septum formation protein
MQNREYVLASASPRRIEMMQKHGLNPRICPANIDENLPIINGMKDTVMFLAFKKAKYVEENCPQDVKAGNIIIAADTVVYKDKIMGKPENFQEAFEMLCSLRGESHYVVTGVAIVEAHKNNSRVFAEVTKVYFKDYTDQELIDYLNTDEAYDKAGGYAIQGYFSKYIDKIEGDYDNVVGFPLKRIEEELKKL